MKNKEVKRLAFVLMAAAVFSGSGFCASAEEAATEAAAEAPGDGADETAAEADGQEESLTDSEASADEQAREALREDYYGVWESFYVEKDGTHEITAEWMIFPDGSLYEEGVKIFSFSAEDDALIVDAWEPSLLEELEEEGFVAESVSFQFKAFEAEDTERLAEAGFDGDSYFTEEGTDKVLVCSYSITDDSDPLAAKTQEVTGYLVKMASISTSYANYLFGGKTWDLDGKELKISEADAENQMALDLNSGEYNGTLYHDYKNRMVFKWGEDGLANYYMYAGAENGQVTLINEDDPSIKIVLTEKDMEGETEEAITEE